MPNKGADIAIIGGSGLYDMEGLTNVEFLDLDTPFGKPSDVIAVGTLEGAEVAFLPRHGSGHHFNPTHIPSQANIYALKTLGVQRVISVSAVGSLKEEFEPLHLVVPNQLIDRTRQRSNTFFERDMVVHISFADPFCPAASRIVQQSAQEVEITVHPGGTMVVMEGPAFSTRAESFMYRSWGADLIGMTALPEAKLAREAEMCYATMAWVTDYDTWRQGSEPVSLELVVQNLVHNVAASKELLRKVVPRLGGPRECSCSTALKDAIITPRERIPDELIERLAPITGKYLS